MSCISDKLTSLDQELTPAQKAFLKFSRATIQCIDAFLRFLARNPALMGQFKTLLQGIEALIDLQIALVQLFITQLDVQNQVINAIIQPFRAFREQMKGQLFNFLVPFKEFERCPPVQEIKSFLERSTPVSKIPGLQKLRAVDQWIKAKEYQLLTMRNYIQELNKIVEQLRATKIFYGAIIDAIEECLEI